MESSSGREERRVANCIVLAARVARRLAWRSRRVAFTHEATYGLPLMRMTRPASVTSTLWSSFVPMSTTVRAMGGDTLN